MKGDTVTVVITGAPYGDEDVWNGLRLALTLSSSSVGANVNVFLLGDSVGTAKKGQGTPKGYYNLGEMLQELIERGVGILACGSCLKSRGLILDDLVDGVKIGSMIQLSRWIMESDKVLNF
jgi:uncharacterized protein involved in oxidation of intracellular sulfur